MSKTVLTQVGRALKQLGVGAIDIDFGRPTTEAVLAEMARFGKAVIEKI